MSVRPPEYGGSAFGTAPELALPADSVEKLEIARTPDLDQLRMQSGMPSNHLRGHQPEVLHRDIDFTGYPLTYKEAPRPIGAAIFAASPEIEFFNRIGQKRTVMSIWFRA